MLRATCLTLLLIARVAAATEGYEALGKFERQTVGPVLERLGLTVDPQPTGKRIRNVIVENQDVFSEADGAFLQWFNIFHVTTRPNIIERELLFDAGDRWEAEVIEETLRWLRDPVWSNVVVILPIQIDDPGAVDVLVVTRDVWSLRLNSNFQIQQDQLTLLSLSLAENNFLGWRKKLAVVFHMDQGAFQIGPTYNDGNIGGTRLRLDTSAAAIFNRSSGDFEGTRSDTTFQYPLWSLRSDWAGGFTVSHYDSTIRLFRGAGLRTYDAPDTGAVEEVPWAYRYTLVEGTASATYQYGRDLIQRLSVGYEASWTRAGAPGDFAFGPDVRAAFERDVLPRQELTSGLFFKWAAFTPEYVAIRDFRTYDLREDYRVGPSVTWSVSQALETLGSDDDITWITGQLIYAFAPGLESYLELLASWSGRLQGGELIDQVVTGSIYGATPKIAGVFRAVFRADVHAEFEDRSNTFYVLGGETGLRGYPVGSFTGQRRLRTNLELRSSPLALWFLRVGGVLFWDMGHAADTFDALRMHHDVGLGIRILIPQINVEILRVDWAFPLSGPQGAWPGRVSLGFLQAF